MMDDSYPTEEFCPTCNSHLIFTKTYSNVHYGRLDCPSCHKFIKWLRNPENDERKRNGTSKYSIKQIMEYHKFDGKPFCFFCLRAMEDLGKHETLTIDHIQEIDKGGKDILENLQILCFACHKLKNWARLYLNWHFKEDEDGIQKIS